MYCPICTTTRLVLSQRQEVAVDFCPGCRGVWLDRGELDKLLKRASHGRPQEHPTAAADEDKPASKRRRAARERRRNTCLPEISKRRNVLHMSSAVVHADRQVEDGERDGHPLSLRT